MRTRSHDTRRPARGDHGLRRRTFLTAAALTPLGVGAGMKAFAAPDSPERGEWSAPFDMGGVAIHSMLMHTDDVLTFQYVEGQAGVDQTSWVGSWNWRTGTARGEPLAYPRDIFCSAHNTVPDGRVFISGGHDYTTGKKQDPIGVAECDLFDPVSRTWRPTPPMGQKRWYPTNVGLPDGRTLIFGGQAASGASSNTVDEYDVRTNTMRRLPSSATKPVGMYPRMFLLPNGRIVHCGPQRKTSYLDPASSSWSAGGLMVFGSRSRGGAVLLQGARRILTCGGGSSGSPTATAEILDTTASTPRWRYTAPMSFARLLHNLVVLPDGKVLAVGGGAAFKYTGPVKVPELFDPVTETWTAMAPQQAGRMYHSTALLLPDGRVLSAGQDSGSLARFGEVFSPPYLFRGPRPVVSTAPSTATLGGSLQLTSAEAADITRVVLIRPGSTTHQIDTDQRSVPLAFSASGSTITAQLPPNPYELPPGHYLLFVVNSTGVPAVAPWVRIS